jgi:hypothetical protein
MSALPPKADSQPQNHIFFEKSHAAMQATSNATAMIVQYWTAIPNRVISRSKKSKNSSMPQNYIGCFE